MADQRGEIGGEQHTVVGPCVVHRCDTDAIATEDELSAARVPDGEGEVALQPGGEARAPGQICAQQRVGRCRPVREPPFTPRGPLNSSTFWM